MVGLVDRDEAIGIALRAGDDLGAIGVGVLADLRRGATRLWQNIIAVGFRLVAQPRAVGERALHVAERFDDGSRRIDLGELDLSDIDPGAIGIEDPLQQLLRIRLDLAAALGERVGDLGLADDFAHRAFGRRLHRGVGRPDVEQKGPRVLDHPKHGEVDVDDVLVTGQHQRFFGLLTTAT